MVVNDVVAKMWPVGRYGCAFLTREYLLIDERQLMQEDHFLRSINTFCTTKNV